MMRPDHLRALKVECDEAIADHEQTLRYEPTANTPKFSVMRSDMGENCTKMIGRVIED
jgi:hypothetical protein